MMLPLTRNSQTAYRYNKRNVENPGLLFERYLPMTDRSKDELDKIRTAATRADEDLRKAHLARWKQAVRRFNAVEFPMTTDWRFFTGAGKQAAYEVGFEFNRYGFPYLPGSGVKGVARAWALLELAESLNLDRKRWRVLSDDLEKDSGEQPYSEWFKKRYPGASKKSVGLAENFRLIFGTPDHAGRAIFLDAVPNQNPVLEVDILNPHFSQKPTPTDDQKPIMVYFLTVARDMEFLFAVGWRNGGSLSKKQVDLRNLAKGWLVNGLKELGAGAKTSAGYGYFKEYIVSNQAEAFLKLLESRG